MKFMIALFGDIKNGTLTRMGFLGYNCLLLGIVLAVVFSLFILLGDVFQLSALLLENKGIFVIYSLFFSYVAFVLIAKRLRDMGSKQVYLFAAIFALLGFFGNMGTYYPDLVPFSMVGTVWYALVVFVVQFTPSGYFRK